MRFSVTARASAMLRAMAADDDRSPAREAAAAAALDEINPDATIGLGSGRALWRVVELIGERWPDGPPLRAATASERTAERAAAVGIEMVELKAGVQLELAIDGADEIDPDLGLIKGGGAALLREKLVISAAERFVCVAETGKKVERLGQTHPLPVEVVRFAWEQTRERVLSVLPSAELRVDDAGNNVVTDEGHYLLDCAIPTEGQVDEIAARLKSLVGVVEHGLFLGMTDLALLGTEDGEVERLGGR